MKSEFDEMNVDVLAISTDPEVKAKKFRDDNLIRPDRKLHIMDVSNAPFSRPDLKMLKSGIAFVQKKDYPIRGES